MLDTRCFDCAWWLGQYPAKGPYQVRLWVFMFSRTIIKPLLRIVEGLSKTRVDKVMHCWLRHPRLSWWLPLWWRQSGSTPALVLVPKSCSYFQVVLNMSEYCHEPGKTMSYCLDQACSNEKVDKWKVQVFLRCRANGVASTTSTGQRMLLLTTKRRIPEWCLMHFVSRYILAPSFWRPRRASAWSQLCPEIKSSTYNAELSWDSVVG